MIIIFYHGARSGFGFIAGGIADKFGIKWPLSVGIALYTTAVAIISIQNSLTPIVALRVPQGIGVAILFTLAPALIARAFGPSRRGSALGFTLAAMGAGTFTGALGGGLLGEEFGWPAIFWMRIPIGIALLITTMIGLNQSYAKSVRIRVKQRFDLVGSTILFASLFTFVLGLSFARVDGWIAPLPMTLLITSGVLGLTFTKGNKAGNFTILPSGLTNFPGFKSGAGSNFLVTVASFVMWFLFPFYVTDVMGKSVLTLGALLALMAIMNLVGSAVAGYLADRIGDRLITLIGAMLTAVGLVVAGMQGSDPAMLFVILTTMVIGVGFGAHQAAVYALTLRGTPTEHAGSTAAGLTVSQTIGTVVSIALMTSLLNWQQSISGRTFVEAYQNLYLIAGGIAVLAGAIVIKKQPSGINKRINVDSKQE
ncbi:MAG: MFS transporter [SAR202 cluster bacterium]|nr:MFS transporter [SAR202 cluster bacterium]